MTKLDSGVYNIYKEKGLTSAKVVAIVKNFIKNDYPEDKVKVGHFGTLDPDASGVLPIAIGKATKLFDYFIDSNKTYDVKAEFGYETNTLDKAGQIIKESKCIPSENEIIKALADFRNGYYQIPPKVSAKSINGIRAYKLAYSGKEFELTPQFVRIERVELLNYNENILSLHIECGKGFYVRSFVRDLAIKIGSLATVSELKRVKSGPFKIDNAVKLGDLSLERDLIHIEDILFDIPEFKIDKFYAKKVLNGVKCDIEDAPVLFRAYYNSKFIGIGQKKDDLVSIKTWLF